MIQDFWGQKNTHKADSQLKQISQTATFNELGLVRKLLNAVLIQLAADLASNPKQEINDSITILLVNWLVNVGRWFGHLRHKRMKNNNSKNKVSPLLNYKCYGK